MSLYENHVTIYANRCIESHDGLGRSNNKQERKTGKRRKDQTSYPGFNPLTREKQEKSKKVIEVGQAFQIINLVVTLSPEWVGPRPLDHSELRDKGD
jgi:hypothetical protein